VAVSLIQQYAALRSRVSSKVDGGLINFRATRKGKCGIGRIYSSGALGASAYLPTSVH
jgi:hypothetical protein